MAKGKAQAGSVGFVILLWSPLAAEINVRLTDRKLFLFSFANGIFRLHSYLNWNYELEQCVTEEV